MFNIKIGDKNIKEIKLGDNNVSKVYLGDTLIWDKGVEEEPVDYPKVFQVGDVLPATENLKIAWTDSDIKNNNPWGDIVKTDNDNIEFIYWVDGLIIIDDVAINDVDWETWESTYRSVCGIDGNQYCGTEKFVVTDTSDWSESERTISTVNEEWTDDVGLTYEDLDA